MKQKTSYKKDAFFLEEEEPMPEKYSPPKKSNKINLKQSLSQNDINFQSKSNKKPDPKSRISKLINRSNINTSHISRAKTTINNLDTSKYENFNIQKQRYNFQKTYLYLHPDINHSFMKRMEFDVYKRHIKEKEIDKLIEENKIKMEEEERVKTFNHLIEDANRRIEAMDNLEKIKKILNNNDITEEPLKKYTDEQWKKIYEERFKTYMEKVKEKKEKQLKEILDQKIKKENDEINLCKVKKASRKHIEKESNKMFNEAVKMQMKKKEKIMRLRNKNKNKYIVEDKEDYEFSNKKKSNKKKNEKIYNFNDDNDNIIIKSADISNSIMDKTLNRVQSIKESKNLEKLLENSDNDINNNNKLKESINDSDNIEEFKENDKFDEKIKKIKFNFFEEQKKENNNEINEVNNKENINNNKDKINIISNKKNLHINLYNKEVSYIIDQFFLRNSKEN